MNWFVCNSQVEYKYDKEMMKGCVMSVTDDKNTILAKQNSELASNVSVISHNFHNSIFEDQHTKCDNLN